MKKLTLLALVTMLTWFGACSGEQVDKPKIPAADLTEVVLELPEMD